MAGVIFLAAFLSPPLLDDGPPSPVTTAEHLKIDVLSKQPNDECPAPTRDEIVVCACDQNDEVHRLRPIVEAEI